jgi:maltose phosphorylase
LIFTPFLPNNWKSYSFRIDFRGAHLEVKMGANEFSIENHSEKKANVRVWNEKAEIEGKKRITFKKTK